MINKKKIANFEKNEIRIVSSLLSRIEENREELANIKDEASKRSYILDVFSETFKDYDEEASAYLRANLQRSIEKGIPASQLILGLEGWIDAAKVKLSREEDDDFDGRFGTCTSPALNHHDLREHEAVDNNRLQNSTRYYPSPINSVKAGLRALENNGCNYKDFSFIDVGSGMGRNLLLASDYPFKKIIGIEISNFLNNIAKSNIEIYQNETQQCKSFELQNINALDFSYPEGNMVLYFWETFPASVATPFIEKLISISTTGNRKVFLVFCDKVFEAVANSKLFQLRASVEANDRKTSWTPEVFKVSIYSN